MAKKATKSIEDNVVTVNFMDAAETKVKGALSDFSDEIVMKLALHGLSQKLGDSYAGAETIEAAIESAQRVLTDLQAGNWTAARASGGGGVRTTLLAEALAAVASAKTGREITVAEAKEQLDSLSDEQKKAVRKDPAIELEMANIKQRRAAEKAANTESQIDSLFG